MNYGPATANAHVCEGCLEAVVGFALPRGWMSITTEDPRPAPDHRKKALRDYVEGMGMPAANANKLTGAFEALYPMEPRDPVVLVVCSTKCIELARKRRLGAAEALTQNALDQLRGDAAAGAPKPAKTKRAKRQA